METKNDYIFFLKENRELLKTLEDSTTITFDLFHPVILCLNRFIELDFNIESLTKAEAEDIFSTGYYYLFNSFDTIKTILKDNFDDDIEEMLNFDTEIYILLRVEDIIEYVDDELLSKTRDNMYSMIENRKALSSEVFDNIEAKVNEIVNKHDIEPTPDYFAEAADILGIELI